MFYNGTFHVLSDPPPPLPPWKIRFQHHGILLSAPLKNLHLRGAKFCLLSDSPYDRNHPPPSTKGGGTSPTQPFLVLGGALRDDAKNGCIRGFVGGGGGVGKFLECLNRRRGQAL